MRVVVRVEVIFKDQCQTRNQREFSLHHLNRNRVMKDLMDHLRKVINLNKKDKMKLLKRVVVVVTKVIQPNQDQEEI